MKAIVQNLSLHQGSVLLLWISGFCFLWFLDKVLSDLQGIIFFPIINRAVKDLTYRLMDHLHSIPIQNKRQSNAQILSSMKRISQSARSFIRTFFLQIPMAFFHLMGSCIIFIRYDKTGLFILIPIFLIGWIYHRSLRWYIQQRKQAWKWTDWTTEALFDSLLSTKLARYHQNFEMNRVDEYLEKEAGFWLKTNTKLHLISIFVTSVFAFFFFVGLSFFTMQDPTAGNFVLIKGLILSLFVPIRNVTRQLRQVFEATVDMENVQKIFSLAKEKVRGQKISSQIPEITLENVYFSYRATQPILQDMNLHVPYGKKVLISGRSGTGKSTLCHLLAGFIHPQKGKIHLGEKSLASYSKEDLGKVVSFIPQQIHFMHASIYENLTYGCEDVSIDQVREALQKVNLDHFVEQLPEQLFTKISEQNFPLSGGERQRLALARAFLRNPAIYILDESLQSLDEENQKRVSSYLLQSSATVFIVSHLIKKKDFDIEIHLTKEKIQMIDLDQSNLYALT